MSEQRLLKVGTGALLSQFADTDTFPAANYPAESTISPTQITDNQDDYSPTGWATAGIVRLSFDTGGRAITGFAAWTNGRTKILVNTSGNFGYIPCEHPDSTAANRVVGACDHIIEPYGTLVIDYDSTSARVLVVANSFSPTKTKGHFYQISPGSVTAADWGRIGTATVGAGNDDVAATSALPGGWGFYTDSSGDTSSAYFAKQVITPTFFGSAHIVSSAVLYLSLISTTSNTFVFSHGLISAPSSTALDVNDSITIQYTHTVNGGNFTGVCRNNAGTESTVDLGVAVAANTLYALTVCVDKALSEARFYINGVMCGVVTGNLPSAVAAGDRTLIAKSSGGAFNDFVTCARTFFTIY